MLCLLISLGNLYNHLIFTLQNAPIPIPSIPTLRNTQNCKISQSHQLRAFLSHTNPLTQRQLSDQNTSRCMYCVHRGVNVKSLAVQYPLYFNSLTRQNELYHQCPQTPPVCARACLKRGGGLTSVCVILLSSFISLSVLCCSVPAKLSQCSVVQPELPLETIKSFSHYCSNR